MLGCSARAGARLVPGGFRRGGGFLSSKLLNQPSELLTQPLTQDLRQWHSRNLSQLLSKPSSPSPSRVSPPTPQPRPFCRYNQSSVNTTTIHTPPPGVMSYVANFTHNIWKTSSLLKLSLIGGALGYVLKEDKPKEEKKTKIFKQSQKKGAPFAPPLAVETHAICTHLQGTPSKLLLLSGPRDCGKLELLLKCVQDSSCPSLVISSLRIAASNSSRVDPESFVNTLSELVFQGSQNPKAPSRRPPHYEASFMEAAWDRIKERILKELEGTQENPAGGEAPPQHLDTLKRTLQQISAEFKRTPQNDPKSVLVVTEFDKILDSAVTDSQKEIVRSFLDWAIFTNYEEQSGLVIFESSDSQILDKLHNIHPMVPSFTHHIPLSHGTHQDALNFIEKSIGGEEGEGEEGKEEVVKRREEVAVRLSGAIGGDFSSLSETLDMMKLYNLPVEAAVSQTLSKFEKILMASLSEDSARSVEIWNLALELAGSEEGILLLDESLNKRLGKTGDLSATDAIKKLVKENPQFFYAYLDGAPLSLSTKVHDMSAKNSLNQGSYWRSSSDKTKTPTAGFVTASSPVFQMVFKNASKDAVLQQRMWEKKKAVASKK